MLGGGQGRVPQPGAVTRSSHPASIPPLQRTRQETVKGEQRAILPESRASHLRSPEGEVGVANCCLLEQCASGPGGSHFALPRPIRPGPYRKGCPLTATSQGHWPSRDTHLTLQGTILAGLQVTEGFPSLASVGLSAK